MQHISIALFVFHFEILGKLVNDEHPSKIQHISITVFVFHFEILGQLVKDEHP